MNRPLPGGRAGSAAGASPVKLLLSCAIADHRAGALERAIAQYRQALVLEPRNFDGLRLLGSALHDCGLHTEAIAVLKKALSLRADFAEAWRHLASAQFQTRQFGDCVRSYERVLALVPDDTGAVHYWRAMALQELGRESDSRLGMQQCLQRCEAWMARGGSDLHVACCFAGLALLRLERGPEALECLDRTVALAPHWPQGWLNRGTILTEGLKEHARALESFDRCLALTPELPQAWYNRGIALERLFRLEEALACFDRCLSYGPDFESLLHRLQCLLDLDRSAEVLALTDSLPADTQAYKLLVIRGWALLAQQQAALAVEAMEAAVALKPGDYKTLMNSAYCCLKSGNFSRGWQLYEKRLEGPEQRAPQAGDGMRWRGQADVPAQELHGRSVLLYAEQGIGDTLQFARYIRPVLDLGARVSVEAVSALHPLLRGISDEITLLVPGAHQATHDFHCPMMSLPLAFGTTLGNIAQTSQAAPYLVPQADRVRHWQNKLGKKVGQRRIGIAVSGNRRFADDARRSMPLASLEPLLPFGGEVHLLQNELRASDEPFLLAHPGIHDHRADLHDFGETAALLTCMDLVLSVDTSIAHLAGALGVPVWILLPKPSEWRWLNRDDSPWYPSARLFRQPNPGNWHALVLGLRDALQAHPMDGA